MGHLIEAYTEDEAPAALPVPKVPLGDLGVKRWQHDLWLNIIQSEIDGHPDQVPIDWHPSLNQPATQRYSASSPNLLSWMKKWNEGRQYSEQIRPFGFLLNYTPRTGVFLPSTNGELVVKVGRGRPIKLSTPKPTAPFGRDPAKALTGVFDRVSGECVESEHLKTYAEVLAQYHLSPESKFENGQYLEAGRTERRHVLATGLVLIGKEANCVGDGGEADPSALDVADFQQIVD